MGGTPLYLKGLLRGIFEGPPADPELRRRLADDARQERRRLAPPAAGRDRSRSGRAAASERHPAARSSPGSLRKDRPADQRSCSGSSTSGGPPRSAACSCSIGPGRNFAFGSTVASRRCSATALVDEVRRLVGSPLGLSKTARQAVGYREVIEHLEGCRGLPETIALVQQHTRQLAKRQSTWFRSLSECRFVATGGPVQRGGNGRADSTGRGQDERALIW